MNIGARSAEQVRNGAVGAAVAVGVVLLLGWSGREARLEVAGAAPPHALSAQPAGAMPSAIQKDRLSYARARGLAARCRGRFERLSAADQAFLNDVTFGHGREFVQNGGHPPAPRP